MKKLIFLLIFAVAFAGFMPALGTAHPPGVLAVNMPNTLEAALYGGDADGRAVSPYTVLAMEARIKADTATKAREEVLITATSTRELFLYARYASRIILWGEQYQAGQLSRDEYASLVAGAITILRHIKPMGAVPAPDADCHLRC